MKKEDVCPKCGETVKGILQSKNGGGMAVHETAINWFGLVVVTKSCLLSKEESTKLTKV